MRRRRTLRPDEEELWQAVARTAQPLHARPAPAPVPPEPAAPASSPPRAEPKPLPPLRLGTQTSTRPHDLAPTLREQIAAHPLKMDAKQFARMSRGRIAPQARIDLHGMTLAEAHPELMHFILDAHRQGMRLVLVITGKGKVRDEGGPIPTRTGVLRHQVPQWLRLPPLGPLVQQVAEAHLKHGGMGAYYVYLRRG
ncbi:Smr/MutS family protein [Falsirhodobacter algicola]|uniref:DNA mismatch repair protein MutS n=1 Tax=Falsirhodobacter algicola TaxID=2692330 RepID=A0A8J8MTK4_9RHOB|nr:Smr/MutS family protein [Falsirhodobacter algicola]QUS36425.1 DNA mismatch repair protein MutS [Falsirhodobacter algicola]